MPDTKTEVQALELVPVADKELPRTAPEKKPDMNKELRKLKAENAELLAENAKLRQDNALLSGDLEEQRKKHSWALSYNRAAYTNVIDQLAATQRTVQMFMAGGEK